MLQDRQRRVWDGRSPKFEFARVVLPQGPGIQLDFTQVQPTAVQYQAPQALFDPMTGQPISQPAPAQFQQGNMPQMVAQTLGGQMPQVQPQMPRFPQGTSVPAPQPMQQAFQGGYQQPMSQPAFPQGQPVAAPQYQNPQIPPAGKMLF